MPIVIRPIARESNSELELVAQRMRQTLVEVLGEERGGSMYTPEWLLERARTHIDGTLDGEILVALAEEVMVGHTIVRIEKEGFGLFSTLYVIPEARRSRVASALLVAGEAWMKGRNMPWARTYTDQNNQPLIHLFETNGYRIEEQKNEFVILRRDFA